MVIILAVKNVTHDCSAIFIFYEKFFSVNFKKTSLTSSPILLLLTGGMSDRGYSSMTMEDSKPFGPSVGSQDSIDNVSISKLKISKRDDADRMSRFANALGVAPLRKGRPMMKKIKREYPLQQKFQRLYIFCFLPFNAEFSYPQFLRRF